MVISKLIKDLKVPTEIESTKSQLISTDDDSGETASYRAISPNALPSNNNHAGKYLAGKDLSSITLAGTNSNLTIMQFANLENAVMPKSLNNIDFRGANLKGVDMENRWLAGSILNVHQLYEVSSLQDTDFGFDVCATANSIILFDKNNNQIEPDMAEQIVQEVMKERGFTTRVGLPDNTSVISNPITKLKKGAVPLALSVGMATSIGLLFNSLYNHFSTEAAKEDQSSPTKSEIFCDKAQDANNDKDSELRHAVDDYCAKNNLNVPEV